MSIPQLLLTSRGFATFCGVLCSAIVARGQVVQQSENEITWQGRLLQNDNPVNGNVDFRFEVYDDAAAGNLVGTQTVLNHPVVDGLYTIRLNTDQELLKPPPPQAGAVPTFNGQELWVELAIRFPAGVGVFQVQMPRRKLTPVPLALGVRLPWKAQRNAPNPGCLIDLTHTGVGGNAGDAICGKGVAGFGIKGIHSNPSGLVLPNKAGVLGDSDAGYGVIGTSTALGFAGLIGRADGDALSVGVRGDSTTGYGVVGSSINPTGFLPVLPTGVFGDSSNGYGVSGASNILGGFGVAGTLGAFVVVPVPGNGAGVAGGSAIGHGVFGATTANNHSAVLGATTNATSVAVNGIQFAGNGIAVRGVVGAPSGLDANWFPPAVLGDTSFENGVVGLSLFNGGVGVAGECNGPASAGVRGVSTAGVGVWGTSGLAGKAGVYGQRGGPSTINLNLTPGVWGDSGNSDGVLGTSSAVLGSGVAGIANNNLGVGVYGEAVAPATVAGEFVGNVFIHSFLAAASTSSKIDHPLDPANKYLVHASVESNEMVNVYSGNVVTDGGGYAIVDLPDYVEALNGDFRYQLTVIGQFAQAIVATEIADGRFTIQTDKPGVKVSWQVTGIRRDAFARAHPLEVEPLKAEADCGKYLHPLEHGVSYDLKIGRSVARTSETQMNAIKSPDPGRIPEIERRKPVLGIPESGQTIQSPFTKSGDNAPGLGVPVSVGPTSRASASAEPKADGASSPKPEANKPESAAPNDNA